MIVLGVILIVAGLLLPGFGILVTIGIVLLIAGALLAVLGGAGHPVGGRRWWY